MDGRGETTGRCADSVDCHVGGRVRLVRKLQGVSQEQLADLIGLTFQQVQKYERGANRVSASKLFKIAEVLQVDIGYFFEGLPRQDAESGADAVLRHADSVMRNLLNTPDGGELAEIFPKIRPGKVRRKIVELARAMAEDCERADLADNSWPSNG